jgi:hypothetical protein
LRSVVCGRPGRLGGKASCLSDPRFQHGPRPGRSLLGQLFELGLQLGQLLIEQLLLAARGLGHGLRLSQIVLVQRDQLLD